jgi:hypothetical protein
MNRVGRPIEIFDRGFSSGFLCHSAIYAEAGIHNREGKA